MAYGCEPCVKALNFFETSAKADLIIIGEKYKEGRVNVLGQPEDIEVKVLKVLKGKVGSSVLKVNSWDGMCPYGIVIDDKHYVIFLEKRQVPGENFEYDAVDRGCSIKTLLIEHDTVNFNGMMVPLDVFTGMLGVKRAE